IPFQRTNVEVAINIAVVRGGHLEVLTYQWRQFLDSIVQSDDSTSADQPDHQRVSVLTRQTTVVRKARFHGLTWALPRCCFQPLGGELPNQREFRCLLRLC